MSSRPDTAGPAAASPNRLRNLSEVVKFTALAALLAIFLDAAIAHAILWGNDPYWTYWITDTLLMASVFGIGTLLFGIGIGRGAIITGVHVLLLTIYYWTLSPIGLPSQPEWLDLERTWITGLPVHLAVYYMGYLGALWLWGRRRAAAAAQAEPRERPLAEVAVATLAVAIGIVVVVGIIQALAFGEFMGVTWFVMRIAVAVPFTVAWWMLAGRDRSSAVVGGIALAFLLTTYSHYLGPIGLPTEPARLLVASSPPAEVHWLPYRELFLVMLPLTAIVAVLGFWLASRWFGDRAAARDDRGFMLAGGAAAAVLVVLGALTAPGLGGDASRVTVQSVGPAGGGSDGAEIAAPAALRMTVANRNSHRTPSPPHDTIDLQATIPGAGGGALDIRASQPVITDPAGRFTTFGGVGFGEWHDGRSGIGQPQARAVKSNVVAFALADIRSVGKLVASRVPVQVSAVGGADKRLDLHVAGAGVAELRRPLHVSWGDFQAGESDASENARYLFGGGLLLVLFGFMFTATLLQRRAWRADGGR
jgi:hypothetical protein